MTALLAAYCAVIVAVSLLGGWVPDALRLSHRRLEVLVSFVAGVMLGVAVLHLLPHAWIAAGGGGHGTPVAGWTLGGFLAMFFVERFFSFHQHGAPAAAVQQRGRLTWAGALAGLTVHSLVAGVALGASWAADAGAGGGLPGFSAFLAIALHKPFDAMTITTLMTVGRRGGRTRHLINAAFGLVVPLGVAAFLLGARAGSGDGPAFVAAALAFSAGTFLCISLSDLLPELQFHQHDRVKLSAALLLGVGVAWGAARLEARVHEDGSMASWDHGTMDSHGRAMPLFRLDPQALPDILRPARIDV